MIKNRCEQCGKINVKETYTGAGYSIWTCPDCGWRVKTEGDPVWTAAAVIGITLGVILILVALGWFWLKLKGG